MRRYRPLVEGVPSDEIRFWFTMLVTVALLNPFTVREDSVARCVDGVDHLVRSPLVEIPLDSVFTWKTMRYVCVGGGSGLEVSALVAPLRRGGVL